MDSPLEQWRGAWGDSYTARNPMTPEGLKARVTLWQDILGPIAMGGYGLPRSVLEVGANVGQNLHAIRQISPSLALAGVEPNPKALEELRASGLKGYPGTAEALDFAPESFDIVFTSGVLIHIPPNGEKTGDRPPLWRACSEIMRVSKRWIVAVEYFSAQPREILYRDRHGLLWARDFGSYYMEHFGLLPVACGFAWKPLTGLDNLTWWVLRKP